jgi:hypothetical protein
VNKSGEAYLSGQATKLTHARMLHALRDYDALLARMEMDRVRLERYTEIES